MAGDGLGLALAGGLGGAEFGSYQRLRGDGSVQHLDGWAVVRLLALLVAASSARLKLLPSI